MDNERYIKIESGGRMPLEADLESMPVLVTLEDHPKIFLDEEFWEEEDETWQSVMEKPDLVFSKPKRKHRSDEMKRLRISVLSRFPQPRTREDFILGTMRLECLGSVCCLITSDELLGSMMVTRLRKDCCRSLLREFRIDRCAIFYVVDDNCPVEGADIEWDGKEFDVSQSTHSLVGRGPGMSSFVRRDVKPLPKSFWASGIRLSGAYRRDISQSYQLIPLENQIYTHSPLNSGNPLSFRLKAPKGAILEIRYRAALNTLGGPSVYFYGETIDGKGPTLRLSPSALLRPI